MKNFIAILKILGAEAGQGVTGKRKVTLRLWKCVLVDWLVEKTNLHLFREGMDGQDFYFMRGINNTW